MNDVNMDALAESAYAAHDPQFFDEEKAEHALLAEKWEDLSCLIEDALTIIASIENHEHTKLGSKTADMLESAFDCACKAKEKYTEE